MIVVLGKNATDDQIEQVTDKVREFGYQATTSKGVERTVIGAVGTTEEDQKELLTEQIKTFPFVENVIRIVKPYNLVSRDFKEESTVVPVSEDVTVGAEKICIMAGPCSVESREQILNAADAVKECGADALRGGAFKPRTSPHAFQGLGQEGLDLLREASERTGLPIVTELMDLRDLEAISEVSAVLQIGTRNMQNFTLLRELGRIQKTVLLKRGMSSTIEEWLQAAEYLLAGGNNNVILCERGVRTFETYTRNTLDLSAVPAVKKLSHLPVVVDPSQGTGRWDLVTSMSLAAIAAGADGLILEVHPDPSQALSDGPQSLTPANFGDLMTQLAPVAEAVGRKVG